MKKIFAALLVLTMVFALLSVREARAELKKGDTCPYCNYGKLSWKIRGAEQHGFICSNTNCEHHDRNNLIWRDHTVNGKKCGGQSGYCDGCGGWTSIPPHTGGVNICTQEGVCTNCGETYGPLGHDLEHHEAQEPTCTEIGWDEYDTCSRCTYTTYVEKQALGHDLEHHAAQDPTCTEIGWDEFDTCSRCDYSTYAEKQALGHDLEHHEAQDPTCTEIGWDEYDACSRCDYSTYAEKQALGHDLEHHEAQDPTCTEIGWDEYDTCSRCDYTTYAELAALGHDLKLEVRTITCIWYRCDRCGRRFWVDNGRSQSLIPGLVRDEAGEAMDYIAGVLRESGSRTLTVTPELSEGDERAPHLYLTPQELAQWQEEGVSLLRFQRGETALEIELAKVGPDWFPPELDGREPDYYVLCLDPAEEGLRLEAFALVGEEKVPAAALLGLTLKWGETTLPVEENGVYSQNG